MIPKLLFTGLLACFFTTTQAQTKNFIDQPYLEVTGTADTLVTPNEIFISILVSERDTKDRTSVEEQETKMVAALKALGINTEKELTVIDMASNFRSYLLKSKDVLKTKQYLLKVTDAVTASKVFLKLEELGLSNTSIDHVDHSGLEGIQNEMRTKAVEKAKARAIALTKPLNQTVGSAINISEEENIQIRRNPTGSVAGVVVRGYGSVSPKPQELPQIDFEKIKVASNVNVKFVLK